MERIMELGKRVKKLEKTFRLLQEDKELGAISQSDLAKYLGVSMRFIADNPEFQGIAFKRGGRVLYPIDKIDEIFS